jgi:brefeldin A-resistance guanine nucleotide exchange factor 1
MASQRPESSAHPQQFNHHAATPITVAVDPVALVVTECVTVTSAMRKHPRWAQSSISAILGGPASTVAPSSSRLLEVSSRPVTAGGDVGVRPGNLARKRTSQDTARNGRQSEDSGIASRLLRGRRGNAVQGPENPLLSAFARLRAELKYCHGMWKGTFEIRVVYGEHTS